MPRRVWPVLAALLLPAAAAAKPNVLVVLIDDQGHGDLGCHGNPKIKTPNLDRLAAQSVNLRHFHVCPVCSPTRSSLLTGRYNYRTGIVDTFLGRSLMRPDEVTLARVLADAGYRTALFGKWHLGDNYPLRPQERGFQEVLMLRGGGIGQPSDPPGGNHYHDPILEHNGVETKTKGYCSDVFTDAALDFVSQKSDKPFFVWLAFNCPHTPLEAPEKETAPYLKMSLSPDQFPRVGQPLPARIDEQATAKIYGMVTNIDANVGRLLARLDERKLADDTIVIFLSDNGPQQARYNSGLRGLKGTVYEGGTRVPCYVRWPAKLQAGHVVDQPTAHIDLMPTLLEACGVAAPEKVKFDGVSLLGLMSGDQPALTRTLYFQWHRGDVPELNRNCAALGPRWKLVQPRGAGAEKLPAEPAFQLFDLAADPYEMNDVADKHPEIVKQMRAGYEAWFKDVTARGFEPPRIALGAEQEPLTRLTRQDWRGPKAGWGADGLGYWEVEVTRPAAYDVTLRFPAGGDGVVRFRLSGAAVEAKVKAGEAAHTFRGVRLERGPGRLEATVERDGKTVGAHYVEVKRAE
jgi:arylsulfatase A-like enzyme